MKLKLDENLGRRGADALRAAGHDVATVYQEGLNTATDGTVIDAATSEGRALVSLDLDFANPLLYPPDRYAGIAVLRVPPRTTVRDLQVAVEALIDGLSKMDLPGRLWIVQRGRIRQYEPQQ
jgi:predicted nuclease of predicted toxin-antitoxin system